MSKFMSPKAAIRVRAGDSVRINPAWNTGERKERKIPSPTIVESVQSGGRSGIAFRVRSAGGLLISVDSGWFYSE